MSIELPTARGTHPLGERASGRRGPAVKAQLREAQIAYYEKFLADAPLRALARMFPVPAKSGRSA